MILVARRFRQLSQLAAKLGVIPAMSLALQYALRLPLISLRPRGYRQPVYCRRTFSDLFILYQALVLEESSWRFVRPPRLIIDAGANIGLVSVNYARQFPEARIVAIEPDEQNFALLCRNTDRYPGIYPIRGGVWSKAGWLIIANPQEQSMSLRVEPVQQPQSGAIRAMTIDQVIVDSGLGRADLLKMDIEGAEREVFQDGAERWLDRIDGILVELHERLAPGATLALAVALATRVHSRAKQGEYEVIRFSSS